MQLSCSLKYVPIAFTIYALISLFLCIVIYFVTAPVTEFSLPPLSQTAVYPPGRYLFSFTCELCSLVMFIMGIALIFQGNYNIEKKMYSNVRQSSKKMRKALKVVNTVGSILVLFAALGLCGLGIVPLFELYDPSSHSSGSYLAYFFQKNATMIHLVFTGGFFITIIAHMIISTIVAFIYNKYSMKTKFWTWFKLAMLLLTFAAWPVFPLVQGILVAATCKIELTMPIKIPESCRTYQLVQNFLGPLNQYLIITIVLLFLGSYCFEFQDTELILADRRVEMDARALDTLKSLQTTDDAFDRIHDEEEEMEENL